MIARPLLIIISAAVVIGIIITICIALASILIECRQAGFSWLFCLWMVTR